MYFYGVWFVCFVPVGVRYLSSPVMVKHDGSTTFAIDSNLQRGVWFDWNKIDIHSHVYRASTSLDSNDVVGRSLHLDDAHHKIHCRVCGFTNVGFCHCRIQRFKF